jgi:AraC family transcriptional activator of mtrCDE
MEVNDEDTFETRCEFTPRSAINHGGLHVPPWLSFDALNRLVNTMDVRVIALSECVLEPGSELKLDGCDTPRFHYICEGYGWLYTRDETPAEIGPQTLIIVPPLCSFRFAPTSQRRSEPESVQESRNPPRTETRAFMLCGTFRSLCGNSTDLFDTLHAPIVEQFSKADGLELKLQLALAELMSRDVCSGVLASTAMKQVIVALIRRSVLSGRTWTRRFVALSFTEHESTAPRQIQERDDIR